MAVILEPSWESKNTHAKFSQDALLLGSKGFFDRDALIKYWMDLVASVKSTEQNGKMANFILEV